MENYFENFKDLLLEEVRAGLQKACDSIGATTFQKINFGHSRKDDDLRFTLAPLDAREEKYHVNQPTSSSWLRGNTHVIAHISFVDARSPSQ